MKKFIVLIFAATFMHCLTSARADEMSDKTATTERACSAVRSLKAPEADQPVASDIGLLTDCESVDLYYGIGQPVNVTKARLCAFLEKQNGDALVFGGSSILMMIYANGLGVKKNIPLAEHYACSLHTSSMEFVLRHEALEKLKLSSNAQKKFDLCDDVTSSLMAGHCAALDQRVKDAKADKVYNTIFARWGAKDKEAFKKLKKAADDFTEARSSNEIDSSGTGRASFFIEEENIQKKDFLESLQKLEAGQAPKYSVQEAQQSDRELNKIYKAVQATAGDDYPGAVTNDKIKATQLVWIKYRDAWVAFAKQKYPTVPSDSVATWFTKKRTHMLKNLVR